jgi:hypothetical protein
VEFVDELSCADGLAAVDCDTELLSDALGLGVLVGGALTLLVGVVVGGALAVLDGVDDGVLVVGVGVLVVGVGVGGRASTQLTDSSSDWTTEPSTPITRTS